MSPINRELLKKYIQGQCTPDEASAVHRWLDDNDIDDYSGNGKEKRNRKRMMKSWSRLAAKIKELKIVKSWRRFIMGRIGIDRLVRGIFLPWFIRRAGQQTIHKAVHPDNLAVGTVMLVNLLSF